jgi:hypothetical protein
VTIFPIIFAIVAGQTIKKFAGYRLERGIEMGEVEQMMGSTSVGGAVMTFANLLRLNLLSVALITVWALSPIGGQSSLQLLSTTFAPIYQNSTVFVWDSAYSTPTWVNIWEDYTKVPANNLYLASMYAPAAVQNSSMDLWDNVKIPDLSRLLRTNPADSNGWANITESQNVVYSSFLGIPVAQLPVAGNTTFTVESSYMAFTCINNTAQSMPNVTFNSTTYGYTSPSYPGYNLAYNNQSSFWFGITGALSANDSMTAFGHGGMGSVWNLVNSSVNTNFPISTILFSSCIGGVQGGICGDNNHTVAYCPITTAYVETAIKCVGSTCAATAIRPSTQVHPNSNLTNLAIGAQWGGFTENLMGITLPNSNEHTSSVTEYAIEGGNYLSKLANSYVSGVDLSLLSPDEIAIGLQHVLNTYWNGANDPWDMMGSPAITFQEGNTTSTNEMFLNTTAQNVVWKSIYKVHWDWYAAFIIATTALLFAAVVCVVVVHKMTGPDILGHFSWQVRHSPYMKEGVIKRQWSSSMGGMTPAKEFASLRVKLVDVEPYNEVGHIALAEDSATSQWGDLKTGRLYY